MALGDGYTQNLYCAAGYFSMLETPENAAFLRRYRRAFGANAPVQSVLSESCYEGMHFLAALGARAGSLDSRALRAAMEGVTFNTARGTTTIRDGHAVGPTYLARADGVRFEPIVAF